MTQKSFEAALGYSGNIFIAVALFFFAFSTIIGLSLIHILNSSPKEIKNIIEEAAGIKKLQANRLEAQKNLGNIEVNLDKVEFILNETRENKNKIEKQAELAQKYIDLKDEKSSLAKGIYITELEQKEKNLVENEDIKIKFTGLRPGEKLYEEVLSNEENTVPTDHYKIRIAKVREYKWDEILASYDKLAELALSVKIEDTVRLMKQVVPEFKSNNSVYEKLDKENAEICLN